MFCNERKALARSESAGKIISKQITEGFFTVFRGVVEGSARKMAQQITVCHSERSEESLL